MTRSAAYSSETLPDRCIDVRRTLRTIPRDGGVKERLFTQGNTHT